MSAAKVEVGAASGATERVTATATTAGAKVRTGKATAYHHREKKCAAGAEERTIGYFPISRGKQRRILCHQFTLYLMASAE